MRPSLSDRALTFLADHPATIATAWVVTLLLFVSADKWPAVAALLILPLAVLTVGSLVHAIYEEWRS